jgi:Protein of unknown function (DUF1275)
MNTSESARYENGGYPARDASPLPTQPGDTFQCRLRKRMTVEIDTKWGDVVLVGCFFCAGLIDSVAFNIYSCFVSMQTGMSYSAAPSTLSSLSKAT